MKKEKKIDKKQYSKKVSITAHVVAFSCLAFVVAASGFVLAQTNSNNSNNYNSNNSNYNSNSNSNANSNSNSNTNTNTNTNSNVAFRRG